MRLGIADYIVVLILAILLAWTIACRDRMTMDAAIVLEDVSFHYPTGKSSSSTM